jgi:hypothetical protein
MIDLCIDSAVTPATISSYRLKISGEKMTAACRAASRAARMS